MHPTSAEPFRRVASAAEPRFTDLGVWNVFANPDFPAPQARLWSLLCREQLGRRFERHRHLALALFTRCAPDQLLDASVARFKTPGLRDLDHSLPLMHDGQQDSIRAVLSFYRGASERARAGRLRNGDPAVAGIALTDADLLALEAFLHALDEDYE